MLKIGNNKMSSLGDKVEQYLKMGNSRVLAWMFDEGEESNGVKQKVLFLNLSESEFLKISQRDKKTISLKDALAGICLKGFTNPEVRILNICRLPHYSASTNYYTISDNDFNTVVKEINAFVDGNSFAEREAMTNG